MVPRSFSPIVSGPRVWTADAVRFLVFDAPQCNIPTPRPAHSRTNEKEKAIVLAYPLRNATEGGRSKSCETPASHHPTPKRYALQVNTGGKNSLMGSVAMIGYFINVKSPILIDLCAPLRFSRLQSNGWTARKQETSPSSLKTQARPAVGGGGVATIKHIFREQLVLSSLGCTGLRPKRRMKCRLQG